MFLELKNIKKMYDEKNGIKNINLSLEKGEFLTLLGPSGCGKTTTLNVIGGFLKADQGQVFLDGQDITNLPAEERPVSTVFQSYALFPHMNVLENIIYGLKHLRKMDRKSAEEEAQHYLEIVGLAGYGKSRVGNLSGGQQQRVALARSMATKPKLLLLDEPLSNLDASLRSKMRRELKNLQEKLSITMILVTHDQEEALSMSDQILVMDQGQILQTGSPYDIYFRPVDERVSSFIGKVNYMEDQGRKMIVRPENIRLHLDAKGPYTIVSKSFLGSKTEYLIRGQNQELEVEMAGLKGIQFEPGQRVSIKI